MKKIFIGLVALIVTSCTSYPYIKGHYTLGERNVFNDFFYTYNIRYYDQSNEEGVDIENYTIRDYQTGVKKHAIPGSVIALSKIYQKEVYTTDIVRPNKKGALSSYTVPVEFSDEKIYKIIGEVQIEGKIYRLLEPNRIGDIVLIDAKGNIYPRVGRIYNERLALLATAFILEPEDLKFIDDVDNRIGDEEVISGYEVRYVGLDDYYMVFTRENVKPNGNDTSDKKKTYKFPMYDKTVDIEDMKLEIFNVNDGGIEYEILQ